MDSHYPGLRQKAMRTSARLEAKRSGHLRPTPNAHWSNSFHIFVLTDDDASFLGDGIYVFVMTGRDFRWCDRLAHWSGSKQPRGLYWSHEWITECRFVRWFWLPTFWTSTSVFINHKWMQFCCRMNILSSNLIFNIICWISTNLFFFFVKSEDFRLSPEPPEEHLHDKQGVKTKDDKVEGGEVQQQIRTVDQFFSHVLFPAFEHNCGPHTWRYRSSDISFFPWKSV